MAAVPLSSRLLFRQLFEPVSCTYTYLLAAKLVQGRPGLLIDPVDVTAERDLQLVQELGVTLKLILNTHVHADHVTGSGIIKSRLLGVQSVLSAASRGRADVRVHPGESIPFGNLSLLVRATPGHTSGCVTYVLSAPAEAEDELKSSGQPETSVPVIAFTGDALLIRGCGRTDFQEGNSRTLYHSVHSQIFSLPEDTLLYPAHDYKGRMVTTVGEEKRLNPRLTKSEDEFEIIMKGLNLPYPKRMDVAVPLNLACGFPLPWEGDDPGK